MSFNGIRENKILAKISGFTVAVFSKNEYILGTQIECQMVWIRAAYPDLGPNCF